MNIKVNSGEHEVAINFDKEEVKMQNDQKVTVSIHGADIKEDSVQQQDEDKEAKYFGMDPWEIYQLRKNDPDFTDRCWVGYL